MKLLIVVDSKHGSTLGIAEAMADELRTRAHQVDVRPATASPDPRGYGAVLIGSAIYMGAWREDARQYIDQHQAQLAQRPVWLFSSGPLSEDQAELLKAPKYLNESMGKTKAIEHKLFLGSLDREKLGFGEKLITRIVRAPEGDFRQWDHIRAWAQELADKLEAATPGKQAAAAN